MSSIGDLFVAVTFEIDVTTHNDTDDPIIWHNDKPYTLTNGINTIKVAVIPGSSSIVLRWDNKTGADTVCDTDGNIVADKNFRITRAWLDGIIAEPWFITESVYRPKYFKGVNGPAEIKSPYMISFPGTIEFAWEGHFWDWYKKKRLSFITIENLDIDPDRVWKFQGSYDMYEDLVKEFEDLISEERS